MRDAFHWNERCKRNVRHGYSTPHHISITKRNARKKKWKITTHHAKIHFCFVWRLEIIIKFFSQVLKNANLKNNYELPGCRMSKITFKYFFDDFYPRKIPLKKHIINIFLPHHPCLLCVESKQYVSALRKFRWWAEINFLLSVFLSSHPSHVSFFCCLHSTREKRDVWWGKKKLLCAQTDSLHIYSTLLKEQ